jgi:uncharacterized damage-inducible protein DinB
MPINAALLPEFDHEMATTRSFLAILPEDKLGWQPHPKSATLGNIAIHLMMLPTMVVTVLTTDSMDVANHEHSTPPATREAMLAAFDQHVATARTAIADATDETFMSTWTLLAAGKVIFAIPRVSTLRTMVLSHNIHHRAQLGVYYRLLDLPVPASYGPTADEKM